MHLYGIDCGNGALLPLADLPHCGAVVSRTQAERAARLLKRLGAELSRRQELLAEGGFADIGEQRAAAPAGRTGCRTSSCCSTGGRDSPPPWARLDAGGLTDVLTRLLGEGASAGMHLVMTGDRSLLAGRISALCEEKLVFKLAEKDDYRLAGLHPRDLPDDMPPGRAFRAGSGTETAGGAARARRVRAGPGRGPAASRPHCRPPRRGGPALRGGRSGSTCCRPGSPSPTRGGCGPAAAGPAVGAGRGGRRHPHRARPGPGRRAARASSWPARPSRGGPPSCCPWPDRCWPAGAPVVLVTPRPSPLRALAARPASLRLFDRPELGEAELAAALASFAGPGVVLIDDAELLRDCERRRRAEPAHRLGGDAGRGPGPRPATPRALWRGFSGWQVDAQAGPARLPDRAPALPEGDLIGARLTHAHLAGGEQSPVRSGRALLNTGDGNLITVTVPVG